MNQKKNIWLFKISESKFSINPYEYGGHALVGHSGVVILFYNGIKVFSDIFSTQRSAIEYLLSKGWEVTNPPKFFRIS